MAPLECRRSSAKADSLWDKIKRAASSMECRAPARNQECSARSSLWAIFRSTSSLPSATENLVSVELRETVCAKLADWSEPCKALESLRRNQPLHSGEKQ